MTAADLFGGLRAATGRRYPHVVLPKAIVMPMTASMDLVQKRLPKSWRYPADHDVRNCRSRTHVSTTPSLAMTSA